MSVKIGKTAGFCYGVKRAVDAVYDEIEKGNKIATLGKLIHNEQVVADLKQKGVDVYTDVAQIPDGTSVIVRTHGVSKSVIDNIDSRGLSYIDLTCPFVNKIHKIVYEHYTNGYEVIIIGDKTHPEVIGINGWCDNKARIIYKTDIEFSVEFAQKNICIVAQTTINREIFEQIVQIIKKTCKSTLVFDTICNATKDRQKEALQLSKECDVVFVVGGQESSNTRKLFEISKGNCDTTFHIETFEDIPQNINLKNKKIGITAGASTPRRIIEEVLTTMDEKVMSEFAQLLEQYESKSLNNGDIVDGTVIDVNNGEAIVDLGGFKYNGILKADQITDDPYAKITDLVKCGDVITVYVVGVNDAEGRVVLSRKKLVAMESWNKIKEAFENGDVLEGRIIKAVKGGVIVLTEEGAQVFIPAKHASARYVQDLNDLLNENVSFKLIDMDERRRRVVGSVRILLDAAKKEIEDKFWNDVAAGTIAEGQAVTGTVKKIMPFGAFVDIGGVDGLVHISELSWNKIKDPSEVVKEGDVVSVNIRALDQEKKKISLGYKKQEDNPWNVARTKFNIGDTVTCKIVRMMPFGAFAELVPSVDGLIHISQIADKRIGKPEDVLEIGQTVEAKITDANWDDKKISLSIRALIAPTVEEVAAEEKTEETLLSSDEAEVPVDIEKMIREQAETEE